MKIYITGISGFLSINIVRFLLEHGYTDISGIDLVDFTYPERDKDPVPARGTFVRS